MSGYVTLMGAEDVLRAGRSMQGAAETISRAAECIDTTAARLAQSLEDHATRIVDAQAQQPTLRDYFASHVSAPGDLSSTWARALMDRETPNWQSDPQGSMRYWIEVEARYRFALADAMLKVRSA